MFRLKKSRDLVLEDGNTSSDYSSQIGVKPFNVSSYCERSFIANVNDMRQFEKVLKKVGEDSFNHDDFYEDEKGQKWKMSHFGGTHGCGYLYFVKLPELSFEMLLDLLFTSKYEDEVFLALINLPDTEIDHVFLEIILDRIDAMVNDISPEKASIYNLIIKLLGIHKPFNRRVVLGKKYSVIQADMRYYNKLAERSSHILLRLEKVLGYKIALSFYFCNFHEDYSLN